MVFPHPFQLKIKIVKISCLIAVFFFSTSYSNGQAAPSGDTSKLSGSVMDSIYIRPKKAATLEKGNWADFLQNHMTYPHEAMKKEIQGTVVVQFIVETDGSVSNIVAISGPEALRDNAVHLVMKSPKWKPATNEGENVRSSIKQPIVYRLSR
jgi:protein TonB